MFYQLPTSVSPALTELERIFYSSHNQPGPRRSAQAAVERESIKGPADGPPSGLAGHLELMASELSAHGEPFDVAQDRRVEPERPAPRQGRADDSKAG